MAAAPQAAAPSLTVTAFTDLECANGAGTPIVLTLDSCGKTTGGFQSVRLPTSLPPALQDQTGSACGLRIFDNALFNCTVAAENLIDPTVGLGKCVPTLITGNFAGPQPAQAITLNCGPEV